MEIRSEKKQKKWMKASIAFFLGIAVSTVFFIAIICGFTNYKLVDENKYKVMSSFYEEYGDLYTVDKLVDNSFYLDSKSKDHQTDACKGVVDGLGDKYSSYMTANEYENFLASATGEYSGIGVTFSQDTKGNFVVLYVNEKSPAKEAGIKEGDYITKVNGKSYKDQDLLAKDIRGKKGTKVSVTYKRNGKENIVEITRTTIHTESVTSKVLDGNVGYISITQFIENTGSDFNKALNKLKEKNCSKLILDLRNNGGGIVDQCVNVADEFLDEGIVTYTEDKQGKKNEYKAKDGKTNMQVVVLVNENSASASEILAGALQDNGYKLVGTKTFGKGIIQSTVPLKDGSALKLTIAEYFTPHGNKVHKQGITPDYKVKNSDSGDNQLKKAESLFK